MNYKKKRYDIHIRMYPGDFDDLWAMTYLVRDLKWSMNDENKRRATNFEDIVWKLHNKMIEINRR